MEPLLDALFGQAPDCDEADAFTDDSHSPAKSISPSAAARGSEPAAPASAGRSTVSDPLDPSAHEYDQLGSLHTRTHVLDRTATAAAEPPTLSAPADMTDIFAPKEDVSDIFAPKEDVSDMFAPKEDISDVFAPKEEISDIFAPRANPFSAPVVADVEAAAARVSGALAGAGPSPLHGKVEELARLLDDAPIPSLPRVALDSSALAGILGLLKAHEAVMTAGRALDSFGATFILRTFGRWALSDQREESHRDGDALNAASAGSSSLGVQSISRPSGKEPATLAGDAARLQLSPRVSAVEVAWALQCDCHATLLDLCLQKLPDKSWASLRTIGAGFWLPVGDVLTQAVDGAAKVSCAGTCYTTANFRLRVRHALPQHVYTA